MPGTRIVVGSGMTLAAVLVACAPAGPPVAPVDRAALESRGRAVVQAFQGQLKAELVAALADGPEHAIGVCSVRAPEIAAELSVGGVAVGRATHRPRNPANAASGWLEPIVAEYVAAGGEGGPRLVDLPDGRHGWVEPIRIQAPCLACHGTDLAAPIAETLRRTYPDDRAVGFAEGDFRGVVWVTLPAAAPQS